MTDEDGRVREIQVKRQDAGSRWVWGAVQDAGRASARAARAVATRATARDEYLGTLVNA